jgi:uncharacterized protein YlxW (UPF0749 family)
MPDQSPDQTPEEQPDQAPGEDRPGGDGRDRLRNALAHPHRSQVVVGLLLAVLGFAFVVQVRDYQSDDTYSGLRETELIEILDGLTGTAERARREVERLEATRDDLQTESRAREAALAEAEQRARNLSVLAGLVPVRGPGIRVTVNETEGRVSVGSLLDMVQELRTANAEAMEFNDEHRLAAQSSFEDAPGGIELDGELLEPPYVLDVIGDPHTLEGALTFSTGPVETLENLDGATVTIEQLDEVEVTSVREAERPTHAEPDGSQ